jgi:hypothetical protein
VHEKLLSSPQHLPTLRSRRAQLRITTCLSAIQLLCLPDYEIPPSQLSCHSGGPVDVFGKLNVELMSETSLYSNEHASLEV